jgi:hypothetical protein
MLLFLYSSTAHNITEAGDEKIIQQVPKKPPKENV